MNLFIWILAGAVVGWVTYAFLKWNEPRGMIPAIFIGATGGIIGGKLIAPMFTAVALAPADFRMSAMIFAIIFSAALAAIANMVLNRWEI